jgi:predicted transport protein
LVEKLKKLGSDVEFVPKKAYVSVKRKKQFAIIQPSTKTRLDLGINIKGKEPQGKLEASGSYNAMVSHRVRLQSVEEVNDEVLQWLKEAYEAAE